MQYEHLGLHSHLNQTTKKIVCMKTKSNSRCAFFIPRVALGGVLCSAGVLLAVAALNKSVAETPVANIVASQPGTWTATSSMSTARWLFAVPRLADVKALVAGGSNYTEITSGAKI